MEKSPAPEEQDLRTTQAELAAKLRECGPTEQHQLLSLLDRYLTQSFQLQFLREVFFRAADAMCVLSQEGHLLLVNEAFCRELGAPLNRVLGERIDALVDLHPDRFRQVMERLQRGIPEHDYELVLPQPAGSPRVLSLAITPMRDPVGELLAIVVARDVSARRELERQVVEWQSRARQYLYALHPPEIAEAFVTGQLEARNLQVSVLFTDITNFTGFTARVSASEVAGTLHRYFTEMTEVVLEHHGWVDKFVGDSIMAVFGVPAGSPDHAQQACRAAYEMNRRMLDLKLPWRHRIGMATGQVIAGDIGSRQKPTYTTLGGPVNLASRLTMMARPGEVLVCESTRKAVAQSNCTLEDLGEWDVRGHGSERVFRLLAASA